MWDLTPGQNHRSVQVLTRCADNPYVDPDSFVANAPRKDGTWWPEWAFSQDARSGTPGARPAMGALQAGCALLCDAQGTDALQD